MLLTLASPVGARPSELSPYTEYMRARAASVVGMPGTAMASYRSLLERDSANPMLATRAFREAIINGDRALALRAARVLEASSSLPPEGRVYLLADAVQRKDWKAAQVSVDRIEQEDAFGFLVPVLRGWLAFATKDGDPLAKLTSGPSRPLTAAYVGEHRGLILLASGKKKEALDTIKAQAVADPRLSFLAARTLVEQGDRAAALTVLNDDMPALKALSRQISQGKPILPGVEDASEGIGELLIRVAFDINRERVTPLSLSLARSAMLLWPENSEITLQTAELLGSSDQVDTAINLLGGIKADDPLADAVRDLRIRLLVRAERKDEALAAAQQATTRRGADAADWSRLGDIYAGLDRHAEAVAPYRRALEMSQADPDRKDQLWSAYLLLGSALERSKNWPEAKAALRKAVELGPKEPVALNYLGYAQLEHGENRAEAEKLIEQASALRPDDAAITDSLGWAYYLRGDLDRAIEKLERAAAGEPGEPSINEHLGDAYWSAGRKIDARFAWRAALVHADPSVSARINRKIDFGLLAGELSGK